MAELHEKDTLIALAKEIVDKHSVNEFEALKMAEREFEENNEGEIYVTDCRATE